MFRTWSEAQVLASMWKRRILAFSPTCGITGLEGCESRLAPGYDRQVHNLKVAGSNPVPATSETDISGMGMSVLVFSRPFPAHSRMVPRSPCSTASGSGIVIKNARM